MSFRFISSIFILLILLFQDTCFSLKLRWTELLYEEKNPNRQYLSAPGASRSSSRGGSSGGPQAGGAWLITPDLANTKAKPNSAISASTRLNAPLKGKGFSSGIVTTIPQAYDKEWKAVIRIDNSGAVKKGEALHFSCWVRAPGGGEFTITFQENGGQYRSGFSKKIKCGGSWQQINISFKSPGNFPAGKTSIKFMLGSRKQTVEIGDVRLTRGGPVKGNAPAGGNKKKKNAGSGGGKSKGPAAIEPRLSTVPITGDPFK
jgi:hypothetical protein